MKKLSKIMLFTAVLLFAVQLISFAMGESDSAATDGKKQVTVWTVWTEATQDANAIAFYKALETAKTDLPDIEIIHDGTENEAYKTKIKTAVAADEMPDVFFAWGAGFVGPFVEAGKVMPLDNYLKDGTLDRMKGGANTNFIFDGKTYGITFTQWVASLFCNKAIFDKYGIKLPETIEDLKAAVQVLNENGVIPITVSAKDRWPAMFWQNALAIRTASADVCNMALNGNASFDTPDFVKSARILEDLVSMNAFVDGALGIDYDESGALFLTGQAAMYYMGSWFAGDIVGQNSTVADDIVAMPFPTLKGGKGGPTEFLGGAIDGLCVSQSAQDKEAAAEVVKYLMEQVARNLEESGAGLPTWDVTGTKTANPNPVTEQIKSIISNATGYVLAWDTFLSGADADDHKNMVAEIFGGQLSPEEFAKQMQEINE
jgi:raffinose/stachyose/melibiose transport system substrate-binding protein